MTTTRTATVRGDSRRTARGIGVGLALSLLAATSACLKPPTEFGGTHKPSSHPVLFIGNSLTYTNNLPGVVAALAEQAGDTIDAWSLASSNAALIDHYHSGEAASAIKSYQWEYVVLQQGPSTVAINRDTLVLAAQLFDPLIRSVGARPALFMVWPDNSREAYFDDCRESYRLAAQAVGGVFMPAGEAWRAVWAKMPSLALYGSDGFHPSQLGTYVAALEIFERITGRDARTLPPIAIRDNGSAIDLPEATVRLIHEAVHEANQQHPAR